MHTLTLSKFLTFKLYVRCMSKAKVMHLKFQCALRPDDDILVEALFGIVRQLES